MRSVCLFVAFVLIISNAYAQSTCVDTNDTYLERATGQVNYRADTGYIIGTNPITEAVGDNFDVRQGQLTGVLIWFALADVNPNDSFIVYAYNTNPLDTLPVGVPIDSAKLVGSAIDTTYSTDPINWTYVAFPHKPLVTSNYAIMVQTYYSQGINIGDTISIFGNEQGNGKGEGRCIILERTGGSYHLSDVWTLAGAPLDVDAMIFPVVTESFYATAAATQTATCPGLLINLSATAFSCSGIASYYWSGPGINNPNDSATTAVIPTNQTDSAVYTVMIIDSTTPTPDTLIKTVTVPVKNISVNAGNDTTIACGATVTLIATISGNASAGTIIQWQDGPSGLDYPNVGAGTYFVNVTNSTGCSASDNITVSLSDGQTASFELHTLTQNSNRDTITSDPCSDQIDTFVNTSSRVVGWTWTWSYTGGGIGIEANLITEGGAFPLGVNTVTLVGDSGACSVTTSYTFTLIDCGPDGIEAVWPGDANDDGIVDYNDVLQIALVNGATGPARVDPTIQWVPQNATDWNGAKYGLNDKFSDCNGDGIVNFDDTLAVAQNYGLNHNKTGAPKPRASDPVLSLVPASDSILPNTPFQVAIMLGNVSNPVDTLYGLAFSIYLNPEVFDATSIQLTASTSWWGSGALSFRKLLTNDDQLVMVLSATNQKDVLGGYGQIGELTLMAQPTLSYNLGDSVILSPSILRGITFDESPRTFNVQTTQVSIISGINNVLMDQDVSVYPNPNNGHFQLTMNEPSKQLTIELMNIEGMVLYTEQLKDVSVINKDYDFNTLAKGVYLFKISNENGVVVKRLVVQ